MVVPINSFDRGKPFYPLVMSYILQLLGLKELMVRGLVGPREITNEDVARAAAARGQNSKAEVLGVARDGIEKLLGALELRSEFTGSHTLADADELARELVSIRKVISCCNYKQNTRFCT